jgi:hypothetical protein
VLFGDLGGTYSRSYPIEMFGSSAWMLASQLEGKKKR